MMKVSVSGSTTSEATHSLLESTEAAATVSQV